MSTTQALLDALTRLRNECDLEGLRTRAGFDCWLNMADEAIAAANAAPVLDVADERELPPLPSPRGYVHLVPDQYADTYDVRFWGKGPPMGSHIFTAEQMREYARSALIQPIAKDEPVAFIDKFTLASFLEPQNGHTKMVANLRKEARAYNTDVALFTSPQPQEPSVT